MVAFTPALADAAPTAGEAAAYSIKRLSVADVDEQAASLREWDQLYEQMTPGCFVGGLHEMCFAGVQLFRESTSQAVHEAGAPWRGRRAVGVPVRIEGAARFRGASVDADAVVTVGGGEELDFYTPRGFEILGVTVDEAALAAHSRQVEQHDMGGALAGAGVLRPGAQRADELRRLLASILQSLEVNPVALQHRQTQRVLGQTVLSAIVALADEAPVGTLRAPAGPASRQQIVDAAKAYMRSRIAEPITVADLCGELGVSRRTLQYAFGEVLGLNPVAFLRAMRLNGVRRDLRAARVPGDKVQDIAARWGFWHLGHFVTDYRRMFGELPSQTLNDRRRAESRRPG